MKFIYSLIAALSLNACAHHQQPRVTTEDVYPIQVADVSDDSENSVRSPERVKRYPVGRYRESDDVMHERHTVYRVEQDADWNLRPEEEYDLPLGPTVAVSDPATASNPYLADVQNKLAQQQSHLVASSQQVDGLHQELEAVKAEAAKVKEENDKLKAELEQRKKDAEPKVPAPLPPPVKAENAILPIIGLILGTNQAFTSAENADHHHPVKDEAQHVKEGSQIKEPPQVKETTRVIETLQVKEIPQVLNTIAVASVIQQQESFFEERMTHSFLDSGPLFPTSLSNLSP